jgi:hypothetical protein
MANTRELLLNAVKANKPKVLIGLNQKGTVTGRGVSSFPSRRQPTSPANRQGLTHRGTQAEHGKPVPLPIRESNPQGAPIEVQVEDGGGSKGCAVMAQIEGLPHTKVG